MEQQHPYYRCRFPAEYALTAEVKHPKTVYVRQDQITPALDRWLTTVFDPANVDDTCARLASASEADRSTDSRAQQAAITKLKECDEKLARHRNALESGVDPTLIAKWIAEVQADRTAAERLVASTEKVRPLSAADIREMVHAVGDKVEMLGAADPKTKAALYASLGITLTYRARPPYRPRRGSTGSLMC